MTFPSGVLRLACDRRGITQGELARIADVSVNTVVKACKGVPVSKKSERRIREALAVIPVLEIAANAEAAL